MSFQKAEQLLTLATLVASRHAGATLEEVIERFEVSKRTGQRMLRALEAQFPDTAVTMDDEGHKRWHLSSGALRDLMTLYPEELAAPDLAMESLKRLGLTVEAEHLLKLREKILALVPRSKAARLETDHEALLEAQGLAARPGPHQRIDRNISAAIAEGIKACQAIQSPRKGLADDFLGEVSPRHRARIEHTVTINSYIGAPRAKQRQQRRSTSQSSTCLRDDFRRRGLSLPEPRQLRNR